MRKPKLKEPVDKGQIVTLEIVSGFEQQRLDKALTGLLIGKELGLSRVRLQALLKSGQISLDNEPILDVRHKTALGEQYVITIPPPIPAEPRPEKIKLKIIHEDADLLVIDKPVGLVVHPAPGNREHTLVNALLSHCGKSLSGIGGVARPGIVHRLDKDTSGLMVVAKNDHAHQFLTKQFSDKSLHRIYQAIVWGSPQPSNGSVDAPIGRSSKDRKKMAVTGKGRSAVTHYKTLEEFMSVSLIECKLETGRTHQIRVHMAHIKHPVLGDPQYGGVRKAPPKDKLSPLYAFPRQALHAVALQLVHPRSQKTLKFSSPLPKDMAALLKKLREAE